MTIHINTTYLYISKQNTFHLRNKACPFILTENQKRFSANERHPITITASRLHVTPRQRIGIGSIVHGAYFNLDKTGGLTRTETCLVKSAVFLSQTPADGGANGEVSGIGGQRHKKRSRGSVSLFSSWENQQQTRWGFSPSCGRDRSSRTTGWQSGSSIKPRVRSNVSQNLRGEKKRRRRRISIRQQELFGLLSAFKISINRKQGSSRPRFKKTLNIDILPFTIKPRQTLSWWELVSKYRSH